jgi:hypothetical protein
MQYSNTDKLFHPNKTFSNYMFRTLHYQFPNKMDRADDKGARQKALYDVVTVTIYIFAHQSSDSTGTKTDIGRFKI